MVYRIGNHPVNSLIYSQVDGSRENWSKGHPRLFKHTLDSHEKDSLHYILDNLANKSLIKLMTIKNKLKERGDRLDHLHPLSFFMGIMTHAHLKDNFYKLRDKNNKAWKEFLKGATNSFLEESRHQNIHDHHLETFCTQTNKDPYHMRHLIFQGRWEEFIRAL